MPSHYRLWNLELWLRNLENRHTQEIQLGLDRVLEVAKKLDLLTFSCKIITVAGTNGKGSTVAALEQLYYSAGYSVGTYTSPHLILFNERIRFNVQSIDDTDLCNCFSLIEEAREQIALTYFETTTLAALLFFKQKNLDVLVLEVGMGGRLDATNILDAHVSIITGIDFDHQEFLGSTLEAIGYEKAGILRQNQRLVYADEKPPASILNKALELEVSTYLYDRDYSFKRLNNSWEFIFGSRIISEIPIPSIQLKSAAAALQAVFLLENDLPVRQEHLYQAMRQVFVSGRLQLQRGEVNVLYDVSHNPQSARLLAQTIKLMNVENKIHAVFSALKDKDIPNLLIPLKTCVDYWYPALLSNKRGTDMTYLLKQFANAEILIEFCYNSPLVAFETAIRHAVAGDLIVVYGSFFTVGQVMGEHCNLSEKKEI